MDNIWTIYGQYMDNTWTIHGQYIDNTSTIHRQYTDNTLRNDCIIKTSLIHDTLKRVTSNYLSDKLLYF